MNATRRAPFHLLVEQEKQRWLADLTALGLPDNVPENLKSLILQEWGHFYRAKLMEGAQNHDRDVRLRVSALWEVFDKLLGGATLAGPPPAGQGQDFKKLLQDTLQTACLEYWALQGDCWLQRAWCVWGLPKTKPALEEQGRARTGLNYKLLMTLLNAPDPFGRAVAPRVFRLLEQRMQSRPDLRQALAEQLPCAAHGYSSLIPSLQPINLAGIAHMTRMFYATTDPADSPRQRADSLLQCWAPFLERVLTSPDPNPRVGSPLEALKPFWADDQLRLERAALVYETCETLHLRERLQAPEVQQALSQLQEQARPAPAKSASVPTHRAARRR